MKNHQEMIFSSKKINSIFNILLIWIFELKNKHISKLFFSSKKIIFGRSISILNSINCEFLNTRGAPKVNIFEMENRLWSYYFSVVYMRSDRVRIRNTIDIMRMIAPQFRYYRRKLCMIQALCILTLMIMGDYFRIFWMFCKAKHESHTLPW